MNKPFISWKGGEINPSLHPNEHKGLKLSSEEKEG